MREAKTKNTDFRANRDWLWGAVLALAVVLVYLPVWQANFIWDDDTLLTKNPCIIGPLGLKEIWTTSEADVCPFVITTFWAEHALWGLAPAPYHIVNVLLHAACAIVLWLVLRCLWIPGAWIGAALWALHPVQAESVAWIAEMKNTESGLFFLLAIFLFLRWLDAERSGVSTRREWSYGLSLLFTSLAVASKSSTAILPVVLGLCVWWVEGRWRWNRLISLVPVFLLSVIFVGVSMATQGLQASTVAGAQETKSWLERMVVAGDAIWFYLGKIIWPQPLMSVYPRWEVNTQNVLSYLPLLVVLVVLALLWWKLDSWARPWFFVFAYFLTALLPVLGMADNTIFRYSQVFDHFQYLASMGPLALLGAGVVYMARISPQIEGRLQSILGSVLLLVFGWLSWQHAMAFENQQTLWTDVLAKDPRSWVAYTGLGNAAMESGALDEAVSDYRASLQINPHFPEAYNSLAGALLRKGELDEAIATYREAVKISPGFVLAYNNLGNVLMQKGNVDEALVNYRKALEIYPGYGKAWDNLGNILMQKGSVDEAIEDYRKSLQLSPQYANAHGDLGAALLRKGQVDEATVEFQKALQLDPNLAQPHNLLGSVYATKGQVDNAIQEYEQALKLNPHYVEAAKNLADAFAQKGRLDEAVAIYRNVLKVEPGSADVHNNLGNALLQMGRMEGALAEYREALKINPEDTMTRSNAGAVLYRLGRLDEAINEFQKIIAIHPQSDLPHFFIGLVYAKKGKTDEALAEYQKALAINPNNAMARSQLSETASSKKPAH